MGIETLYILTLLYGIKSIEDTCFLTPTEEKGSLVLDHIWKPIGTLYGILDTYWTLFNCYDSLLLDDFFEINCYNEALSETKNLNSDQHN